MEVDTNTSAVDAADNDNDDNADVDDNANTFASISKKRKRENAFDTTLQEQQQLQLQLQQPTKSKNSAQQADIQTSLTKQQSSKVNHEGHKSVKILLKDALNLQSEKDIQKAYAKSQNLFAHSATMYDDKDDRKDYFLHVFTFHMKMLNTSYGDMITETLASECFEGLWKETYQKKEKEPTRMVAVSYNIQNQELSHGYDLKQLSCRINQLFDWFRSEDLRKTYVAPYFPIVQSSGMGKTKLLFVFKKQLEESFKGTASAAAAAAVSDSKSGLGSGSGTGTFLNAKREIKLETKVDTEVEKENDVACALILSGPIEDEKKVGEGGKVFDFIFSSSDILMGKMDPPAVCKAIFKYLDGLVTEIQTKRHKENKGEANKIVLLFDEAQLLLKEKMNHRALCFRCIRLWLRRKSNTNVVAVFTGTTSKLNNFYLDDEELLGTDKSRDFIEVHLHESGKSVFPPFICLTTIGSIARMGKTSNSVPSSSSSSHTNTNPDLAFAPDSDPYSDPDHNVMDYKVAVPYGRPLFALMHRNGDLDSRLGTIVRRMLFLETPRGWVDDEKAWLNILATRVQMGQTSTEISSDLVSRGYANLTGFSAGVAQICYFPDPVCAHLAMCLMKENCNVDLVGDTEASSAVLAGEKDVYVVGQKENSIVGKEPAWWVEKMKRLFSGGLVRPAKGDAGEVFVALYLLFCGDELRFDDFDNGKAKKFSVNLDDWIKRLVFTDAKKETKQEVSSRKRRKTRQTQHTLKAEQIQQAEQAEQSSLNVTVNFIQFCRNYIRSYEETWESFKYQSFLEYMYKSGTAYYVYESCPLIDCVASIRNLRRDGKQSTLVYEYAPMFISIKAHKYVSPGIASGICDNMIKKANEAGLPRALCVLIIFGSKRNSNDEEDLRLPGKVGVASQLFSDTETAKKSNVVAKVLRIPYDDRFGLSQAFVDMTSESEEISEVLSSHNLYADHDREALTIEKALRSSSRRLTKKDKGKGKDNDVAGVMFREIVADMKGDA